MPHVLWDQPAFLASCSSPGWWSRDQTGSGHSGQAQPGLPGHPRFVPTSAARTPSAPPGSVFKDGPTARLAGRVGAIRARRWVRFLHGTGAGFPAGLAPFSRRALRQASGSSQNHACPPVGLFSVPSRSPSPAGVGLFSKQAGARRAGPGAATRGSPWVRFLQRRARSREPAWVCFPESPCARRAGHATAMLPSPWVRFLQERRARASQPGSVFGRGHFVTRVHPTLMLEPENRPAFPLHRQRGQLVSRAFLAKFSKSLRGGLAPSGAPAAGSRIAALEYYCARRERGKCDSQDR